MADPYFPIAPALPPKPPAKKRNIAAIYRSLGTEIPQGKVMNVGNDQWFFLSLSSAAYMYGTNFDLIMLFDGITQNEVINDSGYTQFFPAITLDTIIMEAG
jgi:hypothetical protein